MSGGGGVTDPPGHFVSSSPWEGGKYFNPAFGPHLWAVTSTMSCLIGGPAFLGALGHPGQPNNLTQSGSLRVGLAVPERPPLRFGVGLRVPGTLTWRPRSTMQGTDESLISRSFISHTL